MSVTQRRSRKQLRHSIGLLLGAVRQEAGQIESTPSETSQNAVKLIDNTLAFGADNEHRGRWIYATDSMGANHTRRVSASSRDERSITVSKAFASVTGSSWIYELWDADISPDDVHEFINQGISGVTRKGSIGAVDESFHTGGQINTFSLSSAWAGIRELSWRSGFAGRSVADLNGPMSELSVNSTVTVDSADFREGSGSARLEIDAAATAGEAMAEAAFPATEARGFDRIEFWHKSNAEVTSSNLVVQLRQGSSTHESVPLPTADADRWKYVSLEIASPEQNGALDAIRVVVGSSDGGAVTTWFDDIKLIRSNSEIWHRVPREFWNVSAARRQFTLDDDARLPYSRLRVTGVRVPALLESDSQICEVDAQYVINAAAAGVLRSRSDRRGANRDVSMQQADLYEQLAQTLRLRMNTPANIRWVDD